ncbi:MAG: S-layer protein domain-containing protein [Candidatus Methanoperedens sp.]|nr:S-layer protein domain-containing protein [Candidatus Methanoperedens sp.]
MIKILTIFALTIILAVPATASNITTVEGHDNVFDMNVSIYKTSPTDQNYTVFTEEGKGVWGGLNYDSTTRTFTKSNTGGRYAKVEWFGDEYVAINGKANKLAKLLINQDIKERKTLMLDEIWELGEGFTLTVHSIDARINPRQVWLVLNKGGKVIDDTVLDEGEVYTYTAKSLKDESDVPVFVTYVDSIVSGGTVSCRPESPISERCYVGFGQGPQIQLKYTWLISQNVFEIKPGDKFGVFEVKEANENYVLLYNKDKINLDQNTIQDTPEVESKIAGATVASTSVKTTPTTTPAPKQPGFEALYAIAGLITAAYFVLRKKY